MNTSKEDSLKSDQLFGQYRIVRLLGRGGMGSVYEAEHTTLEKHFALKLLPAEFTHRPGALDQFKREAKVMASLDHPHIVKVDDFGETDQRYWLRMQLADGLNKNGKHCITLQDYAKATGERIAPKNLRPILSQVLKGLQFAHEKGAVHRDLKPSNILLYGNQVKISDFGLVKVMGEEWLRTQVEQSVKLSMSIGEQPTQYGEGTSTRSMLGTYEYMSPEQKRGEEADEKSDIYAVGLMTYRLLTGRGLGMKRPSQLVEGLPEAWDDFVSDMVEELKKDRIGSCGILLDRLKALEEAPPQKQVPPKEPAKEQTETRSNSASGFGDIFEDLFGVKNEPEPAAAPRPIVEKPISKNIIAQHPANQKPAPKPEPPAPPQPQVMEEPEKEEKKKRTFVQYIFWLALLGLIIGGFQYKKIKPRSPGKVPPPGYNKARFGDGIKSRTRPARGAPTLPPDDDESKSRKFPSKK